ncbi:MAG: M2 family metallopeptidase [Sedimentisphaerales bacterium]|nr:M2 family metallopeptidase [Sedimentisphaerales bacterium]
MKRRFIFTVLIVLILVITGCTMSELPQGQLNRREKQVKHFIEQYLKTIRPLDKALALAWWEAATTGESQAYKRSAEIQLQINNLLSNKNEFVFLKESRESGQVKDPLLARQLDGLYRSYLRNQIDPGLNRQMVELSTQIEERFSTFRSTIDGKKVTDNEIKDILKTSTNSEQRQKAWLGSKQVGQAIADDILKLVRLRNQAARSLGFDNYHTMSLELSEQKAEDVQAILDELYELTKEPYTQLKTELDAMLAENCGVTVSKLQPWHYHDPFFQETPLVYALDLDAYYKEKDIANLASRFYTGIGLDVESILAHSDLYEREGKNPHAFCTDIDKEGDVRILCNIKPNESWMETTLHELGHGVYDKYYDPEMPYLLRGPVHAFTTEGIAMFFGRLSRNPEWMQKMLGLTDAQRTKIAEVAGKYARAKQLIFARWDMVMFNFERQLYADPEQDVNTLWWQLVQKYQHIDKPAGRDKPDWAAKIHIASAPCYYHNYLLGELFASQVHHKLVTDVLDRVGMDTGYVAKKQAGLYLKENVFEPGSLYPWNEMIARATGEPLTPKYFVDQFVK